MGYGHASSSERQYGDQLGVECVAVYSSKFKFSLLDLLRRRFSETISERTLMLVQGSGVMKPLSSNILGYKGFTRKSVGDNLSMIMVRSIIEANRRPAEDEPRLVLFNCRTSHFLHPTSITLGPTLLQSTRTHTHSPSLDIFSAKSRRRSKVFDVVNGGQLNIMWRYDDEIYSMGHKELAS